MEASARFFDSVNKKERKKERLKAISFDWRSDARNIIAKVNYLNDFETGTACGAVGRAVATDAGQLQCESRHLQDNFKPLFILIETVRM